MKEYEAAMKEYEAALNECGDGLCAALKRCIVQLK